MKRVIKVPDDPVKALRAKNAAAGIHVDAETTRPGWLGEPLDVGYAIAACTRWLCNPRQWTA
jgi:hypothetical protein